MVYFLSKSGKQLRMKEGSKSLLLWPSVHCPLYKNILFSYSYGMKFNSVTFFIWPMKLAVMYAIPMGFPGWLRGKRKPSCQYRRCRRCWFHPWVRTISWMRKWQPIPVFLPGESHGQRNMADYSPQGRTESDMTENAHTRRCHIQAEAFRAIIWFFFFFFVSFPSFMETSFQNGSSLVWIKQRRKYMDQNHNHLKVSSNRITESTQRLCNTKKRKLSYF